MLPIKKTYHLIAQYSIIEKLQLVSILLFVSTLTLNIKLNNSLLIASLFFLLLTCKVSNIKLYKTPILFFTSIFIVSCISLSYSPNLSDGKEVLEKQLALFFIPILYYVGFKLTPIKLNIILQVYFLSIFCICAYLIGISAKYFITSGVDLDKWFVSENLYHSFAKPIKMHATYLSLYIAVALFIGFYQFLFKASLLLKLIIFTSMLIIFIALILLSSRIVILSVLFIFFFIYPFYAWRVKYKSLMIVAGCIILLISCFLIKESDFLKKRFFEKTYSEVKMTNFLKPDITYNPIYGGETRADRWYCAIELIKEKPFFGYGTGTEKTVLMQKYKKYNLQNAVINNYDAHNQYLAFAIKEGVLGLIIFVISIGYGFYTSIKYKNFVYLSFILLFSATCLTENVLESNKGIFFFALFNTLFSFAILKTEQSQNAQVKRI